MSIRSRRRFLTALIASTTAVALTTGCGVLATEAEPEVVLIGVDVELTGHGEGLGNVYLQALELRVEQVNQQRLLGNRRLELRVRDNRSDPATSALNVTEMANSPDIVAVITGGCGECAVAATEVVEAAGVPMVSLAATDQVVQPVNERRYVFKLGPNAVDNASVLIAELNRSGVERVGLVTTNDSYGEDGVREVSDAAARAGIDVPLVERVGLDDAESQLARAAQAIVGYRDPADAPVTDWPEVAPAPGLDAVILWLPGQLAGAMARSLREVEYDGSLLLDSAGATELFLTGGDGAALDGAMLIFTETLVIDTVLATSPAKAARKAWFNSYSARYGTYHAFSSFAADAVQLVVEAINRTGGTDREEIRSMLERTQIDGVSGPLRITPDNHSGLSSTALLPLIAINDRWQAAN